MKDLVIITATKVTPKYCVWNIGKEHSPKNAVIFVQLIPGTYTIDDSKVAIKVEMKECDRNLLLAAAGVGVSNYFEAKRILKRWENKEPKGYLARKQKNAAALTIDIYRDLL